MRSPASSSLATTDPATDIERQQALRGKRSVESIRNEPMEVGTRGRLYTTDDIRRRLGCDSEKGYGTDLLVKIDDVDRQPAWGLHVNTAVFPVSIVSDGVIRIPVGVRDRLGLETGDSVRVSMRNTNDS